MLTVTTSGTYNVTVTDGNGCTGETSEFVQLYTDPIATIGGSTSYCTGSNTTLDAGSGYATYLWSTGETTQSVIINTSGAVSVEVTDNNGCTGMSSVSISESSSLSPVIIGSDVYCAGGSTTLDAGNGFTNYSWSTGESTQTIEVSTAGIYSVTVSEFGCEGTTALEVNESEGIDFEIGYDPFCPGEETKVYVNSDNELSYVWSTSEISQTILTTETNLAVTVYDTNDCSNTSNIMLVASPEPNAEFDIQYINEDPCGSEGLVATHTENDIVSWNWVVDGSTTVQSISVNSVILNDLQDQDVIELTVVNTFGCTDTHVETINVFDTPINSNCVFPAVLTEGQSTLASTYCADENLQLCGGDHVVCFQYQVSTNYEFPLISIQLDGEEASLEFSLAAWMDCSGTFVNDDNENEICGGLSLEVGCISPGSIILIPVGSSDGEEGSFSIEVFESDAQAQCADDDDCSNGLELWDDETCSCIIEESIFGCMDANACNYDPLANCPDGSCIYVNDPCDDGDPTTSNDVVQEDCECSGIGCEDEEIELFLSECIDSEVEINGQWYTIDQEDEMFITQEILASSELECDTTYYITITPILHDEESINRILCPGESLQIGNDIIDHDNTLETVVLSGASVFGCDSIYI